MDLMKKIMNSPLMRRKSQVTEPVAVASGGNGVVSPVVEVNNERLGSVNGSRYFGVDLETILEKDQTDVPLLVVKTCEYICEKGQSRLWIYHIFCLFVTFLCAPYNFVVILCAMLKMALKFIW